MYSFDMTALPGRDHAPLARATRLGLLSLAAALALGACMQEEGLDTRVAEQALVQVGDGGPLCSDLMAGQHTDAGDVCITVEGNELVVTYTTDGGWELLYAHLWAGTRLSDMPQTRQGSPQIGRFPYASGVLDGARSYTFRLPLGTFGLTGDETECEPVTFFVAAHAELRRANGDGTYQTETGWADGERFVSRGTWATYFSGELTCEGTTQEETCETAFAYSEAATCFLDIDEDGDGNGDFSRWGWTIPIDGPGSYAFDIYAAAGQCDLEKGTQVGVLYFEYAGQGVVSTVTFDMARGFSMDETHLYVGTTLLPLRNGQFTVAPGQYPWRHDLDAASTDRYALSLAGGPVRLVAHATVCGVF